MTSAFLNLTSRLPHELASDSYWPSLNLPTCAFLILYNFPYFINFSDKIVEDNF